MSEEILRAMMQLFALASNTNDITNESRDIIKHSLRTELRKERVNKFLAIYDEYLHEFHSGNSSYEEALNPENVKSICESINAELSKVQKFIVLFRLLEYIFVDGNISEHESRFVEILCDTFSISEENYKNAVEFTKVKIGNCPDNSQMMVVSKDAHKEFKKTKYISGANFDGVLIILQIKEINMYVFRYVGTSGLFLNGSAVAPERTYIFNSGSALRGNKMNPVYFSDILSVFVNESASEKIVFQAHKISYDFPSGDVGLHEFSFRERTGRLVGIMGGSGSGKSTMLNVLNGNYKPTTGKVTINGVDINKNEEDIKGVIGFISQDDLLIEELTVFQNLFFSAKLSFSNLSDKEITHKVNDVLKSLGLYKVKDLKVGNPIDKVISGGQRKRLNIALELIREPSILFVDEPTSGLSSRDSENIMDLMKELALKGKLVFIVIHQPSSYIFKLFDRLLLLDNGGYTIYYGEPVESVTYFKSLARHIDADESECLTCGNVNSELIFDIIDQKVVNEYGKKTDRRKTPPQEWYKKYKKNEPEKVTAPPIEQEVQLPSSLSTPHPLKQFLIFLKRDVLSKITNKQYLIINLLEAPLLALFISYFVRYSAWSRDGQEAYKYLFNENIPAYIFMAVVVALFIGMTVSAEEIFRDRKLQKREKFLSLSKGSYLSSKFVLLFFISAIQTLLFILVGNSILGIESMYWRYWLVMFSTSFFANMVGLNISNSFNSAVAIYILIPFMIIPQLIFSGVIVSFDRLNPAVSSRKVVPVIGEAMASRWAYEALMVTQFKDNPLEKQLYPVDKKLSQINYLKTYWISELESQLQFIRYNLKNPKSEEKINRFGKIIQNEVARKHPGIEFPQFVFKSDFTIPNIDQKRVKKIEYYLQEYKKYLNKEFTNQSKERDKLIYQIEKNSDENNYFNLLKERYFNETLTDLVRLNNKFNKVIVIDDALVPIVDPVFRDAAGIRSHFYAANKKLGSQTIDTFWFNVGVLWCMSILMMVTLYYDLFKKLVEFFEKGKKR
ncbi:ATP-binding cassette domain-containing protein [bacterium SCSIO 12643]|nr:ATP-binding cassette domain-containing protein [bacterium SCSIO 12643]